MAFENAIEADLLHQSLMEDKVPLIMESVFECTLEMINKDFHEYPEHRVQFFKLLQAINLYCFPALLKLDATQFKFVIDSCMWASKHDNREVENTGLTMCLELMNNMAETDTQTSSIFFRQFFIPILQDVFFVLTDSDHKAGSYTSMVLEELTLTFGRVQISSNATVPYVLLHRIREGPRTHLFPRTSAARDIQQRLLARIRCQPLTKCFQESSGVSWLLAQSRLKEC